MRAVSVVAGLVVLLIAARASADDLRLTWQAPPGCPSGNQVRDAALRSASAGPREPLEADARVEREAIKDGWRVTIRTTRAGVASADRRLEAASCEALADATAVILALALVPADPEPPATPPVAPVAPAAPAARSEAAPTRAAPAVDRAERSADPYTHALAAAASLATDGTTLPSPAVGGRAGLAWTPGRARVELAGSYFSGQSKTTDASAAGAELTLLSLGARGCWAIARGDVELSPCAGADVQMVQARGFGAAQNYDASAAWVSAAGGALFRVPLASWLALRAEADALVPLSRPRFVVEGDGAVHKPAAFGVRAGIGAELLFL